MAEGKAPTSRLHIHVLPALPDVFLVVRNAHEPGAVPVIPTPIAESYWAHPSNVGRATVSGDRVTTSASPASLDRQI
ncbi:MAG TPA: hypothetical protein VED63_11060 [Acidimicrobiales bacterium]|nr:hypothetical protein [Acidimicrobiales bacterium]